MVILQPGLARPGLETLRHLSPFLVIIKGNSLLGYRLGVLIAADARSFVFTSI